MISILHRILAGLFEIMVWCRDAASPYMSQTRPKSLVQYFLIRGYYHIFLFQQQSYRPTYTLFSAWMWIVQQQLWQALPDARAIQFPSFIAKPWRPAMASAAMLEPCSSLLHKQRASHLQLKNRPDKIRCNRHGAIASIMLTTHMPVNQQSSNADCKPYDHNIIGDA